MPASTTPAGGPRLAAIDFARGIAIAAMVLYHATWDLGPAFYGLVGLDAAGDPVLRNVARLIAGAFLLLVGVSLVLAHRQGFRPRAFLRRLAIIAGAAALVSLVSYLIDPATFVRFGILHAIAACSVIGLCFLWAPGWLTLVAAVVAFAAPSLFASPIFDHPAWLWLGLSIEVPPSIDYVPVLPWLGATLLGIAGARLALRSGLDSVAGRWTPRTRAARILTAAGRWSLVIYLAHQPLLLGAFYLLSLAVGGGGGVLAG